MPNGSKLWCPGCREMKTAYIGDTCFTCTDNRRREKAQRRRVYLAKVAANGPVGCEDKRREALDAFDEFSRKVREEAGCPRGMR